MYELVHIYGRLEFDALMDLQWCFLIDELIGVSAFSLFSDAHTHIHRYKLEDISPLSLLSGSLLRLNLRWSPHIKDVGCLGGIASLTELSMRCVTL